MATREATDADAADRKKRRRGHNEGTIRQRADGRWESKITVADGKRKSYYGKTRKEVASKLTDALNKQQQGLPVADDRLTVAKFLDRWIADVVEPAKEPKTTATYADIVRLHLKPGLGSHRLTKLEPHHVAALLRTKRDAGLSPRMVHHIRTVLRTALNQALRWGLVARNVAALVDPPRQEAKQVVPVPPAEARALLTAAEGDRLAALFRVALTLGLRQGEVLGLMWDDVDLDRRSLKVRRALQRIKGSLILKKPKTEKSRRTLTLPPSLVAALRAQHDRQAFERSMAGTRWQETGLIFTTTLGTPLDPRNVIRSWHRIQKRQNERRIEQGYRLVNGVPVDAPLSEEQQQELVAIRRDAAHPIHAAHALPRRNFHSTRHTAASLMLAEGVPVKVVQEVLGHSLLSTTADIYGHLFPEAFEEAASAMERALAG